MDKINFTGGFQFKTPTNRVWEGIKTILPRHKIILPDYGENKDIFIAVKKHYDPQIIKYLRKHRIKFTLYPQIDLKSRLDAYNMEEAYRIIDSQTEVINSVRGISVYLKSFEPKFKFPRYRWKKNDHIDKTLKSLGLSAAECNVKIKNGVTIIKDKSNKIIAKASPNNQKGTNFVFQYPESVYDDAKEYAIDMFGNKYLFPALQYEDFRIKFMNAIKIDNGRILPKKLRKS